MTIVVYYKLLYVDKQSFLVFCWININITLVFDDQTLVFDAEYYRLWKAIYMTEWDDLISQNDNNYS